MIGTRVAPAPAAAGDEYDPVPPASGRTLDRLDPECSCGCRRTKHRQQGRATPCTRCSGCRDFDPVDVEPAATVDLRDAAPTEAVAVEAHDDSVELVLADAMANPSPKIRAAAIKIRAQVKELREALDEYRSRRDAEAEVARLRTELAEAEQKLRAASGKKPAAGKAAPATVDAREVREWARQHSIACPAAGRLPNSVVEAYLAGRAGAR